MKTITGNTVRFPLSSYGKAVNSHDDACKAIGFDLLKEPISRQSTGKAIGGSIGLFRSDNGNCVGIHSPGFTYLQPCESLRVLEKARELVGGTWRSASALKGGASISAFIDIENPKFRIVAPSRGDVLGISLARLDYFDGSGKDTLRLAYNVLACNNGAVGSRDVFAFSSKHCSSLKERFAAMEFGLLMRLQTEVEEMQGVVTKLDTNPMTSREVVAFAERLFPATNPEEVSTRTENMREAVVTGFSRGTGNVGRSRWDAFNAVTEFLDWNSAFRETEFSREENRFESLVTGNAARTRNRAMELLLN